MMGLWVVGGGLPVADRRKAGEVRMREGGRHIVMEHRDPTLGHGIGRHLPHERWTSL
jgi:hypothetical protein